MIIKALMKQAEDFGFEIFQACPMTETRSFTYQVSGKDSDDSVEEKLFDSANYDYWSQDYDDEAEPSYSITGYVKGHSIDYNGLSEDKVLLTLQKMVADELEYRCLKNKKKLM